MPRLYEEFQPIEENFPRNRTTILFIFRDITAVAESYTRRARNSHDKHWAREQDWRVAVEDWNRAISSYKAYRDKMNIVTVDYEKLYCSDETGGKQVLSDITRSLDIPEFSRDELEKISPAFFGRAEVHGKGDVLSFNEHEEVLKSADTDGWSNIFSA